MDAGTQSRRWGTPRAMYGQPPRLLESWRGGSIPQYYGKVQTWQEKNVFKKEDKPFSDHLASYKFWRVFHTDFGGYTEDETEIHVRQNSLSIWQGDNLVYLDKEQLEHVLQVAKEHGII